MGKTTTIGSVEFERYIQSAFRLQSGDTVVYVDPHRLPASSSSPTSTSTTWTRTPSPPSPRTTP